jgi:predicted dehydrogenase
VAEDPLIRVGLLGTGWAAGRHAEALRRLPGVQLSAVAGLDAAGVRAFADRRDVPTAHADAAALLADRSIDAVHVCTINAVHAEQARDALAAGKHVLCEKPLGVSTAETAELVAVAEEARRERGLVSAVCFNYRHYPVVEHLRRALAEREHGAPHFVHGSYLQDWLLRATDWSWRLDERAGGRSRAVADIGSHWTDLAQHLLGASAVEVLADLTTLHPERRRPLRAAQTFAAAQDGETEPVAITTEDFAAVMLRFDNGVRGSFVVSQTSAGHKNQLTIDIDCADASVAWDQERPERVWIGRRGAPNLELVRDPDALALPADSRSALPAGHPEGWNDALLDLTSAFYATVRAAREGEEHASSLATFADGHRIVQLVDAIVESNERRGWVAVGQPVEAGA